MWRATKLGTGQSRRTWGQVSASRSIISLTAAMASPNLSAARLLVGAVCSGCE
jgi:hypothetical protein